MQIVCPNCATSYRVEPNAVGPTGRSVRCARCHTVWFAANSEALADIAQAHRAEMAQFAAASAIAGTTEGTPEPEPVPEPSLDGDMEVRVAGNSVPAADPSPTPVTVADAPPIAPVEPGAPTVEAPPAEDIESVAARRFPARGRRQRPAQVAHGLHWISAGLAVILVSLIGFRTEVVRAMPQTASLFAAIGLPVNIRGLVFADVKTEAQVQNDVHVITIEGQIVSVSGHVVAVPRLRFALRNASGHEIYTWTAAPPRSVLGPGEQIAFQSRLASPPTETHDVLVRFVSGGDRTGGVE